MSATRSRLKVLCGTATPDGRCWRLVDHHGKHVNQRYQVPPGRPLAVVSDGGVLVASYRSFQISMAANYVKSSGGHVVDVRTWRVTA
jgi:hypothetical protein